jgi:hypothetical protein
MAEQQQSILLDVEELESVRARNVGAEKKDNDGNDKTSDLI